MISAHIWFGAFLFVASIGAMAYGLSFDGRAESGQIGSIILMLGALGFVCSLIGFGVIAGMLIPRGAVFGC